MTMVSEFKRFLAELKRRHVYHVAAVYLAVGLGLLGAAEVILDPLGLSALRSYLVILTLAGFPLALVLAWAYEVRPEAPAPSASEGSAAATAVSPSEESSQPSIAVLPFRNMSADPEQEFFCEGISEEIINAICQVENLKVIARTSSFAFKDRDEDVREIGRALGVGHLLEGSVRKAGERLRVTAQLVQVSDGSHLWSERYDRDLEDVFDIQDEISLAIADRLKGELLAGEKERITRHSTGDTEAHELYLKAQPLMNRWTREGMEQAIDYLQEALHRDPTYARAHGMLGICRFGLAYMGHVSPEDAYPRIEVAALKALELDDELPEAHLALGAVRVYFDWDRPAAEKRYRRALELKPSYATAHVWYSWFLMQEGRFEEMMAEVEKAKELDPVSVATDAYIGEGMYFARQYDRAIERLKQTLELDPEFPLALWHLGLAYEGKGMYDDAISTLEKAVEASAGDPQIRAFLGYVYGAAGREEEARRELDDIRERGEEGYASPWDMALLHMGLGEHEQALDQLEKASEQKIGWMVYLKTLPLLDPLRSSPRFQELQRRAGLEA